MLGHQLASMVQWILDHRLLFQVNDPRRWATTRQSLPFICLIPQGSTMTFKTIHPTSHISSALLRASIILQQ